MCVDKTKCSDDNQDQDQYRLIDQSYTDEDAQKRIQEFLEIINHVFTINSPKATQKIGLTYLASIIKLFPEMCDRYLEILLDVAQEIRSDVLFVPEDGDQRQYLKQEYVAGSSAGKYLAYSSY